MIIQSTFRVCIFFSFCSIPNNSFRVPLLLKICSIPPKNIYLHCFQVVWIAIMGNADWKPLQFLCFAFFYRILQKLRATEPPITPIYNVRHFLMLHVCHLMTYSVYVHFYCNVINDAPVGHNLVIQVSSSHYSCCIAAEIV